MFYSGDNINITRLLLNLLIVFRTAVFSFNIEERDPIVKNAPDNQHNSYFGFSVAQHQMREHGNSVRDSWILVGAPLGQNLQPLSNRSGALFKCPITESHDDCQQVETDGSRHAGGKYLFDFDYGDSNEEDAGLLPPGKDEIKTGQWLGVTVKSQKPGGKVMVCGHRYIQSPDLNKNHYALGLCYQLASNLVTEKAHTPCKGKDMTRLHQQYGFCQTGTSLAIFEDGDAVMGSPGPLTWRGTVFVKGVNGGIDQDNNLYQGPLDENPEPIDKYSYLGMSVDGGKCFRKYDFVFVSGAPRSNMTGQVYFLKKPDGRFTMGLDIVLIISGKQIASSFGYQVLVVDVNNDGLEDVLVGAPFYYNETQGGAVYIYTKLDECLLNGAILNLDCEPDDVFYGKTQSRFGISMTSLGDINKDGYNDVAIGAPYENNHGAVYIYLGSKNGLTKEPSQVIRIPNFHTFGYSLSGGIDMDVNNYPDLLVGAYESDKVILFKTRPIIDISISIEEDSEMRNINASKKGCRQDPTNTNYTCFSFKPCFKIMGDVKQTFNVIYHIKEVKHSVSRIWFHNEQHKNKRTSESIITLTSKGGKTCHREVVYIKKGVSDILSPIKFLVNYTLEENIVDSPILNKTSVRDFVATFQKDCGEDDECESELELKAVIADLELIDGVYIVENLTKNFILDVKVNNTGEPAYETKMFVEHPQTLSYIALKDKPKNIKCSVFNVTFVICDLGNPLVAHDIAALQLRFEIRKDTQAKKLNLTVFVNSTSTIVAGRTKQVIQARLQKIGRYKTTGIVRSRASTNLFYSGEVHGDQDIKFEEMGNEVKHSFQIENTGEWLLNNITITIDFPYQVKTENSRHSEQGEWLFYIVNLPTVTGEVSGHCTIPPNILKELRINQTVLDDTPNLLRRRRDSETSKPNNRCYSLENQLLKGKIICYIASLEKGNTAHVEIISRLFNSTFVGSYKDEDCLFVQYPVTTRINDRSLTGISNDTISAIMMEATILPEKVQKETGVVWWIILLAALIGFALLIVLAIVLWKCGFFKRNRVVKDQTLRGNVKKPDENPEVEGLIKNNN